jgi:hypothetical protein
MAVCLAGAAVVGGCGYAIYTYYNKVVLVEDITETADEPPAVFGVVIDDADLCNVTGISRAKDTYVSWKTSLMDTKGLDTLERNLRKMESVCKYAADDKALCATIGDSIRHNKFLSDVSRVAVFAIHAAYREGNLPDALELRMEIVVLLKVAGCVYDSPVIRDVGVLGLYEQEGAFMLDLLNGSADGTSATRL